MDSKIKIMYNHHNPAEYFWRNIEINAITNLINMEMLINNELISINHHIYDLGCGNKALSTYLFPDNKIIGVDLGGNPDIKADIKNMPINDNSVKVAFCNSVLEHINNIDTAIKEISRILDKDGTFIFTVPIINLTDNLPLGFKKITNKAVKHINLLCISEWKDLLIKYNLKILQYRYYLNEASTLYWFRLLLIQKIFGNLFFNRKEINRKILEDSNGCSCSCAAFLATKI